MPARLVYAPRVFVYTKDEAGVTYNLTNYVVKGNVARKINQVSTAEVTLRNPYKRFTTPSRGVAFHPMDPITIYLERAAGHPVRVFTGYLDKTPYYQMYPGTITLQASCTLKRLLYTYFDPSLPYMIAFFEKYGWINTGTGSIVSSQSFDGNKPGTQADVNSGKLPFDKLKDGSLSKLLWATLYDIGEWQDSHIYIEDLPSGANGIAARMAKLMASLQKDQQKASDEFTTFMSNIVGGTQGSGGGPGAAVAAGQGRLSSGAGLTIGGGPVDATQLANLNTSLDIAAGMGANIKVMQAMVFAGIAENKWYDTTSPSNPTHQGLFQSTAFSAGQLAAATKAWLTGGPSFGGGGGIAYVKNHPNASLFEIASSVEVSGSQYLAEAGYSHFAPESIAIVAKYLQGSPKGSGAVTSGVKGAAQSIGTAIAQVGRGAKGTNSNGVINPIPGFTNLTFDKGIDGSAPVGSAILAPAACTIVGYQSNFYQGQPLVLYKFDHPIPNAPTQYWFASEQIKPVSITKGHHFNQGDTVATFSSSGTGIEVGWGNPNTGDMRYAPVEAHYGTSHTGWGWHFYNYFSVGTGSPQQAGATGTAGGAGAGAAGAVSSSASAQAFVAELNFPSIEDQVTAIALGTEHKGLMHDQVLLPFVQQLAQASMRNFQSLPNGDFFAFYPDYFGEMGHRKPYWLIDDIEILNGGIELSDDSLATHVFAVGDNTWPVNNELLNMLFSAGTITIFNAFLGGNVIDNTTPQSTNAKGKKKSKDTGGMADIMSQEEAVKFIERYGARPLVQTYPMVRSPIYEMLLAYQQFMLAWSNQFKTPFTFTFMPELYPGGKVGFPNHGIQMYINSVTHSWNYDEGGFTTEAELSAPSLLEGVNASNFPDIPPHMVQAMVEPVRKAKDTSGQQTIKQVDQTVAGIVEQTVDQIGTAITNILGT